MPNASDCPRHLLCAGVEVTTNAGREALDRLSSQVLPDGMTKALAAGQAVVLAMTPSVDMAHKSFWNLLGTMAGTCDMTIFTNADVAATTVQTMLTMPPGRNVRGETEKLSDNWKDLMKRVPSTIISKNPSLYMMQFVMLQHIAALDGYDMLPDEQQGRQIGELLRKKPLDTNALQNVLSDCVLPRAAPQVEMAAVQPERQAENVKPEVPVSRNLISPVANKPLDRKSGPDGPDF